jgi:DNA polymerase-1
MIVTNDNFDSIVRGLSRESDISLDCEATGLYPYLGDELFSVIIGTNETEFYFNFNSRPSHNGECFDPGSVLPLSKCGELLGSFAGVIYLHNAKYDMSLLHKFGLDLTRFDIWCTLAQGRVDNNDLLNYSLDTLAKRIGHQKDDAVKKYCDENKLFEKVTLPGKKTSKKDYHFELVPPSIIVPYGCRDARITYDLGRHQRKSIQKQSEQMRPDVSILNVAANEAALTTVLYKTERKGIRLDLDYVGRFLPECEKRMEKARETFEEITGLEFKDSPKVFSEAFDKIGESYPLTDRGNPSFAKAALDQMSSPAAKAIKDYRKAKSHSNYLQSFLYHADKEGVIHGNAKQGGTFSGRMSYEDPPLQCVEKGEDIVDQEFTMRRCFIPFEGGVFAALDFDQMEYRLMLDYAGEMGVIEQVKAGVDVHTATAEMMGVSRKEAKTLNFMLLYGGGTGKLCTALHKPRLAEFQVKEVYTRYLFKEESPESISEYLQVPLEDVLHDIEELQKAETDRKNYFKALPNVQKFIAGVKQTAKSRGFIFNWFGRKLRFNKYTYYKAPNGLIQGGCADIVKCAMLEADALLDVTSSDMLLNVHDEILFNIDRSELNKVPLLQEIMQTQYKPRFLDLTVGADIGEKNWQDKLAYQEFMLS